MAAARRTSPGLTPSAAAFSRFDLDLQGRLRLRAGRPGGRRCRRSWPAPGRPPWPSRRGGPARCRRPARRPGPSGPVARVLDARLLVRLHVAVEVGVARRARPRWRRPSSRGRRPASRLTHRLERVDVDHLVAGDGPAGVADHVADAGDGPHLAGDVGRDLLHLLAARCRAPSPARPRSRAPGARAARRGGAGAAAAVPPPPAEPARPRRTAARRRRRTRRAARRSGRPTLAITADSRPASAAFGSRSSDRAGVSEQGDHHGDEHGQGVGDRQRAAEGAEEVAHEEAPAAPGGARRRWRRPRAPRTSRAASVMVPTTGRSPPSRRRRATRFGAGDGVVDHHAQRQGQAGQGHGVERLPPQVEHDRRRPASDTRMVTTLITASRHW